MTASGCVMYGSPLLRFWPRCQRSRRSGSALDLAGVSPSRSWGRCRALCAAAAAPGLEVVRVGALTPRRARRARTRLEEPERAGWPAGARTTGAVLRGARRAASWARLLLGVELKGLVDRRGRGVLGSARASSRPGARSARASPRTRRGGTPAFAWRSVCWASGGLARKDSPSCAIRVSRSGSGYPMVAILPFRTRPLSQCGGCPLLESSEGGRRILRARPRCRYAQFQTREQAPSAGSGQEAGSRRARPSRKPSSISTAEASHLGTGLPDQLQQRGLRGAAGGEDVVDDQDAVAGGEVLGGAPRSRRSRTPGRPQPRAGVAPGSLPALRTGTKPRPRPDERHRGAQDEAAGLQTDDLGGAGATADPSASASVRAVNAAGSRQERGDVLETPRPAPGGRATSRMRLRSSVMRSVVPWSSALPRRSAAAPAAGRRGWGAVGRRRPSRCRRPRGRRRRPRRARRSRTTAWASPLAVVAWVPLGEDPFLEGFRTCGSALLRGRR